MSPDEDALLNGIAADPAADLPRLVYADWLEEHGQELRAEFIRIQCEIAKLEVGPRDLINRNVHLWRRQQELLDGHMDAVLEGVPFTTRAGQVPGPRLHRGFLDEVVLDHDDFTLQGEALSRLRPRPSEVRVNSGGGYPQIMDSAPESAYEVVTALFFDQEVSDSASAEFELSLQEPDRMWPRLHTFTSINGAVSLASTSDAFRANMPRLKTLNLHGSAVNDNDVIDLLNAGVLQRLSHISLIENAIGDQAAIELADRLGNSPNLKELDLRRNGITTVGQAALLARLGSKVILF